MPQQLTACLFFLHFDLKKKFCMIWFCFCFHLFVANLVFFFFFLSSVVRMLPTKHCHFYKPLHNVFLVFTLCSVWSIRLGHCFACFERFTRSLFCLFWAFAFHSHELACYVFAASYFAVSWKLVALLLPRCWADSTDSNAMRNQVHKRRLSTFPKRGWNASDCHEVHPLPAHPSLSTRANRGSELIF